MDKRKKVEHVKRESRKPHSGHRCHWPGCSKDVHPSKHSCYYHWMKLPKYLRDKVWAAYIPGQEISKKITREYAEVAREVQEWIKENYPETRKYAPH